MSLKTWSLDASHATWRTPQAIKSHYPSASFIGNNRVVFHIKGNQHRLVVATAFEFNALYIKFIGMHAEYDRIDASTVSLG